LPDALAAMGGTDAAERRFTASRKPNTV